MIGPCRVTHCRNSTGFAPFTRIQFRFQTRLLHLSLKQILAGVRIEFLDVQILNVEAEIGDAPGDPLVVADDHAGTPGSDTPVTSRPGALRCT